MKFNIKSKFGFTLIELLVVIGILAVLAAIAIPSVAGLIDRANLSADATNSNEMTNAVERFVSEYELYVQDIASGRLDTSNLDSAQGRVYNVTGVTDRAGNEGLEKDATAGVDTTGKAIYRDTKYPVNAETMQAVVENYMKTSSTTFTPKQSDCHYYYSPDCGLVVCTETEKSDVTDLNALVHSGKDAKGKDLSTSTKWIDLTANVSVDGDTSEPAFGDGKTEYGVNDPDLNHNGIIPEGGVYYQNVEFYIGGYPEGVSNPIQIHPSVYADFTNATKYNAGEAFPTIKTNDLYKIDNNTYTYKFSYNGTVSDWNLLSSSGNFILENINNKPVKNLDATAYDNNEITIPTNITTVNLFYLQPISNLTYLGTKEQWNSISRGLLGNATVVHCSDGDITL